MPSQRYTFLKFIKQHITVHKDRGAALYFLLISGLLSSETTSKWHALSIKDKITHTILMSWTRSRHRFMGLVISRAPFFFLFLHVSLPLICICYFGDKDGIAYGASMWNPHVRGDTMLGGDDFSWPYDSGSGSTRFRQAQGHTTEGCLLCIPTDSPTCGKSKRRGPG